jgi:hypothetical protein
MSVQPLNLPQEKPKASQSWDLTALVPKKNGPISWKYAKGKVLWRRSIIFGIKGNY